MKEIPISFVKFSQLMSLLFVAGAILLQMPIFAVVLWLITTISFLFGPKANLWMLIGKLFLRPQAGGETQSAELLRFNTAIAVMMLCLSVAFLLIGWNLAAYIILGLLGAAQIAALSGYCIGCTLYFQIKQWRARKEIK